MAPTTLRAPGSDTIPSRGGRKRDADLDNTLLDAALDVIVEHGYAGMTMDLVAARAQAGKASVYRRWESKLALAESALERLSAGRPHTLPDTGSLRGDLVALATPEVLATGERLLKVVLALASMPEEARSALQAALTGAWVETNATLIRRAVERGEVSPDTDVERMAQVLPSIMSYRVSIERRPIDAEFVISAIDTVLIAALRGPSGRPTSERPDLGLSGRPPPHP